MARNALHAGVRRPHVRGEFRFHHVARLSAELDGLHVRHGAVGELAADDGIGNGHHREEDACPAPDRLAIGPGRNALRQTAVADRGANGNQQKPAEKDHWQRDERKQPDVWIIRVAAHVKRQQEKP